VNLYLGIVEADANSKIWVRGAVRQYRHGKHQPFTSALPTAFEVLRAFPGTQSGSPGIVSNKTELSAANGATLPTLDDL
jgi:hypothetical protein